MPTPGTVEFPTALDGVVSLFEVSNRAYTTLSADINNSVLAIPLTDSTVFPTTGVVTLTDSLTAPTKHEEIIYTANAANSLTVPVGGRGAFGSTAQNWSGTVYVRMRMIAEHHEVLRDGVIQLETKVGYGAATPTVGKFLVGDTTAGTSTWRVLAAADIPSAIDATKIADGSVSNTEFQYLNGVTSAIQTQIDGKASTTAPGSDRQLIFNSSNAYSASANLVFDDATLAMLKLGTTATKGGALSLASADGNGLLTIDWPVAPGNVHWLLPDVEGAQDQILAIQSVSSPDVQLFWADFPAAGTSGTFARFTSSSSVGDATGVAFNSASTLVRIQPPDDDTTGISVQAFSDAPNVPIAFFRSQDAGGGFWVYEAGAIFGDSDPALDASARFQIDSTTRGFLPPRMTTTERDAIATPAEGLIIHNLTTNAPNYYNGSAWTSPIQTITLTGDVTGSGTGSFAATIANDAVTYAKIQNVTDNRLLGRSAGSSGDVQEITIGSGLTLSGGTLSASGGSNPFDDATAIIKGSADATKLLRIEVDGITTGTTRVWTAPDANLTVAGIDLAQTWTANQTFGSGILRATSPQITTGINDSNGASLIAVTATGSAIFGLTLANAASGGTVAIGVTTPTQAASAIAGTPLSITASAAVAGSSNVGAAAGGSVTITAGNAARLTSGNANGGTINLTTGTGIGTGTAGNVLQLRGSYVFVAESNSGVGLVPQVSGFGVGPALVIQGGGGASNNHGLYTTYVALTQAVTDGGVSYYAQAASNYGIVMASTCLFGFSSSSGTTATGLRDSRDTMIGRAAAAHFRLGNTDAASPVAQTLSVQGGSGTNIAGSTWTLRASLGTGNAVPGRLHLAAGAVSATSGTTQQTAVDRGVIGATKVLTNNSAITITNVTVASNSNAGGQIGYLIEVTDGTDFQYETGVVSFGVTNKSGVFSGNTCTKFGNHQNATAGSLTVTFAISGANPALLSCNANSSLTPSTGFPRITYWLMNEAQQAIAIQ